MYVCPLDRESLELIYCCFKFLLCVFRDHCTLCIKEMASFHSHEVIKQVLAEKLKITGLW